VAAKKKKKSGMKLPKMGNELMDLGAGHKAVTGRHTEKNVGKVAAKPSKGSGKRKQLPFGGGKMHAKPEGAPAAHKAAKKKKPKL